MKKIEKHRPVINFSLISILVVLMLILTDFSEAQIETSLRLIGTIVSGNSGGAVLQDSGGKQFFYRLYDKISDGAKIIELRDDSIVLKGTDGIVYEMYISHDMRTVGTAAPSSNFNSASADAPAADTGIVSSASAMDNSPPSIRRKRRHFSSEADEE